MAKGKIVIDLEKYLKEKGISKNKLMFGAQIQRTQLLNYCKNKVTRVDLDVLARICDFLDCNLEDILHYEK